uniref:Photosystem I reaction center subunit II n=1 Tax=Cyanidium sp. THAL103 TaxID=3027999 RepID=A0A9Y1I3Z6_9RHOD|nr:photosystem I subunit II [Cyanidium sp. THAL103]
MTKKETLNLKMPSPMFLGSTGGWSKVAETEEKYAITWNSKKEDVFEMPIGGSSIMRIGDNLIYLSKKEQCLSLGSQLRSKFKIQDYKIYRIFPTGEVQYLHPKDGEFPEKVNNGREKVGNIDHTIGKNINYSQIKFTNKTIF